MPIKILIDPGSSISYGSFYIKGFRELYGRKNVKFSSAPFKRLEPVGNNLRFILAKNENLLKIYINTDDSYQIKMDIYNWCDIYGNVNANFEHYPKDKYPKQISLAPSFGINIFNLSETIYYSLCNFLRSYRKVIETITYNKYSKKYHRSYFKNIKRYFLNYLKNYLYRLKLDEYYSMIEVKDNYIFFLSTLWYNDEYNKNDEGVNKRRYDFIKACKEIKEIDFEGGFLVDDTSSSQLFSDIAMITEPVDIAVWINKTKQSMLVFNTPAFWGCHGWKLGEYLAMGKAIISTPLSNDLPAPLVHGEHIHIIKDYSIETIKEAITYIMQNKEYRLNLQANAKKYWKEFCTPQSSLKLLSIVKSV